MKLKLPKIIYFLVCFLLIFEQSGFAQVAGELNIASHLNAFRSSLAIDKFRPLHLRYLQYLPQENNFNLLLDKGDEYKGLSSLGPTGDTLLRRVSPAEKGAVTEEKLESSAKELMKYFFIGLSLPNDTFWVNLRPDSPDNIIDSFLAQTDVGKILLEADLQLKKDTAQATSPQTPEGKEYWDKLYKKAGELFGSENITIPTLTRPWIVPGEIIIRESTDNAYIYKATLKVMLEQDYLKDSTVYSFKDERLKTLNEYSSQLIRELILPKLTKEINTARRYVLLRQVYYSLILAQWFKQKFSGQASLYSRLIDKKNLTNLTSGAAWDKQTYFKQYQTSFSQGEYNFKDPAYTLQGKVVRSYMSGGINLEGINKASSAIAGVRPFAGVEYTSSPINVAGGTAVAPFEANIKIQAASSSLARPAGASSAVEAQGRLVRMYTQPGRLNHSLSVIRQLVRKLGRKAVIYDIGVGKNAVTARELANKEQDAFVYAIDNQIPYYSVISPYGAMMLFDENDRLIHFESVESTETGDSVAKVIKDKAEGLGKSLRAQARNKGSPEFTDAEGNKIIMNPMRLQETGNLKIKRGDLFAMDAAVRDGALPNADLVRITNVLIPHYTPDDITRALSSLLPFVNEGGYVLIGYTSSVFAGEEESLVYRKRGDRFVLESVMLSAEVNGGQLEFGVEAYGGWVQAKSMGAGANEDLHALLKAGAQFDEVKQFVKAGRQPYWDKHKHDVDSPDYSTVNERGNEEFDQARREWAGKVTNFVADALRARGIVAQAEGSMIVLGLKPEGALTPHPGFLEQFKLQYLDRGVPKEVSASSAALVVGSPGEAQASAGSALKVKIPGVGMVDIKKLTQYDLSYFTDESSGVLARNMKIFKIALGNVLKGIVGEIQPKELSERLRKEINSLPAPYGDKIGYLINENGEKFEAFYASIVSGLDVLVEQAPSDKVIKEGDLVMLDVWFKTEKTDGFVDQTWLFITGKEESKNKSGLYADQNEAYRALIAVIEAAVKGFKSNPTRQGIWETIEGNAGLKALKDKYGPRLKFQWNPGNKFGDAENPNSKIEENPNGFGVGHGVINVTIAELLKRVKGLGIIGDFLHNRLLQISDKTHRAVTNARLEAIDKLKEGMVFTIEPGVYIEGLGSFRLEIQVRVIKAKDGGLELEILNPEVLELKNLPTSEELSSRFKAITESDLTEALSERGKKLFTSGGQYLFESLQSKVEERSGESIWKLKSFSYSGLVDDITIGNAKFTKMGLMGRTDPLGDQHHFILKFHSFIKENKKTLERILTITINDKDSSIKAQAPETLLTDMSLSGIRAERAAEIIFNGIGKATLTTAGSATSNNLIKLRDKIEGLGGKVEIVKLSNFKNYTADYHNKIMELDLNDFFKENQKLERYQELRAEIIIFANTLLSNIGVANRANMVFAIKESIQNAFVHGNKANPNYPIFIRLNINEDKQLLSTEIYNALVDGSDAKALEEARQAEALVKARQANLFGLDQGEKSIKEVVGFKREEFKDETGSIIETKVTLVPFDIQKERVRGSGLLVEENNASSAMDINEASKEAVQNHIIEKEHARKILSNLKGVKTILISAVHYEQWGEASIYLLPLITSLAKTGGDITDITVISNFPDLVETKDLNIENKDINIKCILPNEFRGLESLGNKAPDLVIGMSGADDKYLNIFPIGQTIPLFQGLTMIDSYGTYLERIRQNLSNFGLDIPETETILTRRRINTNVILVNPPGNIFYGRGTLAKGNQDIRPWADLIYELRKQDYRVEVNYGVNESDYQFTDEILKQLKELHNDVAWEREVGWKKFDTGAEGRADFLKYLSGEIEAVITIDTGVYHLARFYGIPTIVFTGHASTYFIPKTGKGFENINYNDFSKDPFQAVGILGGLLGRNVQSASSAMENFDKGGIDFRALPVTTQQVPIGNMRMNLKDSPLVPKVLRFAQDESPGFNNGDSGQSLNLDKEWQQIENMLAAGITPSSERIKEYLQSCSQQPGFNQEIDKVISCIADMFRLEEEKVANTDPSLKAMLILLESDKPVAEMQLALAQITVEAKEPAVIEP